MADARVKQVMSRLVDLVSRANYAIDVATTSLREPLGRGDTIEVPYLTNLTVNSSGASDASPESVTTNVLSLAANLEPWINALLPQVASMQLMDGSWASAVATHAFGQLRNSIDSTLCEYIVKTLCASTSAAYVVNPASDTLTSADILNAKAQLLALDGVMEQNLVLLMHPYGEASVRSIATFVPNAQMAESGSIGIPKMGYVHGVPVYMTNSVPRRRTVACTAVVIATNVATVTAANHGISTGEKVTIAGITTPLTTATAVASTADANTFTVALTAGDGAMGDGAGTVTVEACQNILVDKSAIFTALQKVPGSRIVPMYNNTGDALQISAIWGRIGYTGRAVVIDSPPSSA